MLGRHEVYKAETAAKYGEQQVKLWPRSYDIRPSALDEADPRYPGNDPRYKDIPKQQLLLTECFKDTVERFMPCWHELIAPGLRSGKADINCGPRQQPAGPGEVHAWVHSAWLIPFYRTMPSPLLSLRCIQRR